MNVLKIISSSYVQNMIENMILTSYTDKSYFVAREDEHVVNVKIMSHDKLKHQVRQHVLSRGGNVIPWLQNK